MGQRTVLRPRRKACSRSDDPVAAEAGALCVFNTELGWFGLIGQGDVVTRVFIGHASSEQVRSAANRAINPRAAAGPLPESDWNPNLRRKMQDFARGIPVDFADVAVEFGPSSPFRRRVLQAARRIAYGQTLAYGELAGRAGNPAAARAVGAVMASNPVPVIVPCHRVVASGGSLGGFSAPHGVELKRRLLELEAAPR